MSDNENNVGLIAWLDQTSENAEQVRDFYKEVVGWESAPVSMGDYDDFNMMPAGDDRPVAGICHARGGNADLPVGWLVYIVVENLDKSMDACKNLGGKVIVGPKELGGHGRFCVMKDPAGAMAALYEAAEG